MKHPSLSAWLLVAVLAIPFTVRSADFAQIVRQTRHVENLTTEAQPLIARLEVEVDKIIGSGHLMPFRVEYGEGRPRHLYAEPWMMRLTLARAYPYVGRDRQSAIRAYLREETRLHAPWSKIALGSSGAYRQADPPGVPELGLPAKYQITGTLFYALWLYGSRTGDWDEIKPQWAQLKELYFEIAARPPTYELISGTIAMSRLASVLGDLALEQRLTAAAVKLMEQGANFEAFRRNAHLAYSGKPNWYRGSDGMAFALFHLTPEIARYFREQPALRSALDQYADQAIAIWPLWWMAQAPVGDWGYFDEGSCAGPDTRMMLFNYCAWVRRSSTPKLILWVDVPDALVGDCYYLQNLVTAIEACGQEHWR